MSSSSLKMGSSLCALKKRSYVLDHPSIQDHMEGHEERVDNGCQGYITNEDGTYTPVYKETSPLKRLLILKRDVERLETTPGFLPEDNSYQIITRVTTAMRDAMLSGVANNQMLRIPLQIYDHDARYLIHSYEMKVFLLQEEYCKELKQGGTGWESMSSNMRDICYKIARDAVRTLSELRYRFSEMKQEAQSLDEPISEAGSSSDITDSFGSIFLHR